MSSSRPDLPVNNEAAHKYVSGLLADGRVEAVYVKGSRSPKTEKPPRPDSDWDFEVITSEPMKLANPRVHGWLHADVHIREKPSQASVPFSEVVK